MPANLTPQYHAAEEAYRRAVTLEDKMEALREMLSVIPKHKGTERLQGDIKRRLAKLKEEGQRKAKSGGYNPFHVERQGAGQVVLVGYPNTGKSALVAALTRAKVKVADYPFTTAVPTAGMMPYEDILIQLVDTPPLTPEGLPPGLLNTLRSGDLLLLLVDSASSDCLEQLEGMLSLLTEKRVIREKGKAQEKPGEEENESDTGEIAELELEEEFGRRFIPYLLAASKTDRDESEENLQILRELVPGINLFTLSVNLENSLDLLKKEVFDALRIIRIFTKAPGKPPDMETPFVLKKGSTILDLAYSIHRDFPDRLKNARVWGSSRFDGQTVSRDYPLEDRDIVELNV